MLSPPRQRAATLGVSQPAFSIHRSAIVTQDGRIEDHISIPPSIPLDHYRANRHAACVMTRIRHVSLRRARIRDFQLIVKFLKWVDWVPDQGEHVQSLDYLPS